MPRFRVVLHCLIRGDSPPDAAALQRGVEAALRTTGLELERVELKSGEVPEIALPTLAELKVTLHLRRLLLTRPLTEALPLPVATALALEREGFQTAQHLIDFPQADTLPKTMPGLGPKRMLETRCALAFLGVRFRGERCSMKRLREQGLVVLRNTLHRFALMLENRQSPDKFRRRNALSVFSVARRSAEQLTRLNCETVDQLLQLDLATAFPGRQMRRLLLDRVNPQLRALGIPVLQES